MAVTEAAALYKAIAMLAQQVQLMAEQGSQRGGGGGGKSWDHHDRFKNFEIFSGDAKDFEEWSVKLRSLVAAADIKVNTLMKSVEAVLYRGAVGEGVVPRVDPRFHG